LIFGAGFAQAQTQPQDISSVSGFLTEYDTGSPIERKIFEFSVASTEQGLLHANAYLVSKNEPRMYCQPAKLTLTPQQLIEMLRKGAKTDARLANLPVAFVILQVLIDTFPCS
jgi:hypothetical protein